ncbi:hypothetical protein HZF05_18950 [Sphingomonas sp. CGMCC 1.13654]|uniref:Glycosyltransferase RgtA/B/C/D-like domain-containing protein n=1 Tax=Sphingomonas chungangi TaxID=2683589 RepID=A0A838LDF2_9SPHN|nr:hypothetical protein [Sphingomonas chungangi]MBA2936166.1 hypothetical protein [Sphingomonas chungangi]MVW55552.1 hypothetical protein [Sphingomonas chungangi]
MTAAEAAARRAPGIPLRWLIATLFALVAASGLLLPAFLGLPAFLSIPLVIVGAGGISLLVLGSEADETRIVGRTLAICFGLALALLILGGEGRLLFAPADWQIRDAVLADLGRHRWPFAYVLPDGSKILRAPLGMYLLPALAGGGQRALDLALLGQNAIVLGLVLAIASSLFAAGRPRRAAATVFFLFSGLDAIGMLIAHAMGHAASFYHLENWAWGLQYTATISQLFWAPQHALAGWACAALFLLWQQGKVRIGTAAAGVPLFAFWSPLAVAGAVPFLAYAGLRDLKRLRPADCALPLLALAISAPALWYQHAGAATLYNGPNRPDPLFYALSLLLEVAPFVLPALIAGTRFGRAPLWIAVVLLVLAPLWRIGDWADFQMRVTIVPLCLLAAAIADLLLRENRPNLRRYCFVMLAIGSLTMLSELFPVLTMRASPPPLCSLPGVWTRQTGMIVPNATYLASVSALPVRPAEIVDPRRDPPRCWSRGWITPAWTG